MATSPNMPAPADLAPADLDDDDKTLMASPVSWSAETVKALHKIVYEETSRTMIVPQVLPHFVLPPKTTTVPLNLVNPQYLDPVPAGGGTPANPVVMALTIDEGQAVRVYELWTEIALTDQQVNEVAKATNPEGTSMAVATRIGAQYHAQAHDYVAFQGALAYSNPDTFFSNYVGYRAGQIPLDGGLFGGSITPGSNPPYTSFPGGKGGANPYAYTTPPQVVPPLTGGPAGVVWGDNMLEPISELLNTMSAGGNSGPFGLFVPPDVRADMSAPAGNQSLAITYDRVAPQFELGVHTTRGLPTVTTGGVTYYSGVIVSGGGNAVSLGVGQHARLRHMQRDPQGWHRFRIVGRHVLLVSDLGAVGQLVFQGAPPIP
jgi:hypothetical protein